MRPTLVEAKYHVALDRLAEETNRSKAELESEISTEAQEVRSRQ